MIEFIGGPLLIASAGLLVKNRKMSDKAKIKKIFNNARLGLVEDGKPKLPEFVRKSKIIDNNTVIGTDYTYRLPLGYPSKKIEFMNDEAGIFEDGLNKKVRIEYDGMLHIKVYDASLPEKWDFKEIELLYGSWKVPLGRTVEGIEWYDFDKFPNMVNGGSAGFGKSTLLKSMMTALILQNPEDVELYIIDLKGGLEFDKYKDLTQVKGVASNPVEANEMLNHLSNKLKERFELFKRNKWSNIVDTPLKKRTFIIVDEAHELVSDKWMHKKHKDMLDECMYILQAIASLGRGLGFRMLYCTQYPTADSCPKNIKQNSNLRISFKLPDPYASAVILGEGNSEAAELPSVIGRAVMKNHEMKEIQIPYIDDKLMESLTKIYTSLEFEEGEVIDEQSSEEEGEDGSNPLLFG